jgi:hypothetical protein
MRASVGDTIRRHDNGEICQVIALSKIHPFAVYARTKDHCATGEHADRPIEPPYTYVSQYDVLGTSPIITNGILFVQGKAIPLTDQQLEGLGFKRRSPYDVREGDRYVMVDGLHQVNVSRYRGTDMDQACIDAGNAIHLDYRELANKYAAMNWLNALLRKFAHENGGEAAPCKVGYSISIRSSDVRVCSMYDDRIAGAVAFASEELCQRAIDKVVLPFIQDHPEVTT